MAKSAIIRPELPEASERQLKLIRIAGETEVMYHVMYDREDSEVLGIMTRDNTGFWEFADQRRVPEWLAPLEAKLAQAIVVNGDV